MTLALRLNLIVRVRHLEDELDDEIRGELGDSVLSDGVRFKPSIQDERVRNLRALSFYRRAADT